MHKTQEILYRLRDVVNISGKGRSTIYRDIRAGEFPAPVRLGQQSVAWRKSATWIAGLTLAHQQRSPHRRPSSARPLDRPAKRRR